MSLLSPLRPILRNANPLLKFLGNAFTDERILQRPTPRHFDGRENFLCTSRLHFAQLGSRWCFVSRLPGVHFKLINAAENVRGAPHSTHNLEGSVNGTEMGLCI